MNRSPARSTDVRRFGGVPMVVVAALILVACAPGAGTPQAAAIRQSAPPWDAPRDAVSYLEAVGLDPQSTSYRPASKGTLQLAV